MKISMCDEAPGQMRLNYDDPLHPSYPIWNRVTSRTTNATVDEIAALEKKVSSLQDLRRWRPMTESPIDQRQVYVRRVRKGPEDLEEDLPRYGEKSLAGWRFCGAYGGKPLSDWEWTYIPGQEPKDSV